MKRRDIWGTAAFFTGYLVFVFVFREQAESALSTVLTFIGGVL